MVVEALDRLHQPDVALLDEIEQGERPPRVPPGDRHHEPEIGLDERALGLAERAVALLDLAEGGVPPGPDRSMAAPHRSDQLVHHVRPQRQALDQAAGAPARDRGARQARAQPAQAREDPEEPVPLSRGERRAPRRHQERVERPVAPPHVARRREQGVDPGGEAGQGAPAPGPADLDPPPPLTLLRGGEAIHRADLPEVERHRVGARDRGGRPQVVIRETVRHRARSRPDYDVRAA